MPEDERGFIRRLQARDEDAFTELVRRYQDPIYNFLLRMVGRPEEAEDLAQEVFVSVFKHIHRFRGDAKLSTWLFRVASNHCKNRLKYLDRRHTSRTSSIERVSERHMAGSRGAPHRPDQVLEGREMEAMVQAALATLEPEQREMIVLRDLEGLSYREICQVTGLNEGTVKSKLHRARLGLRRRLDRLSKGKIR